jgi:hypothetical protein
LNIASTSRIFSNVFGNRDDEQSIPHHERPLSGLAIHDKSDSDGREVAEPGLSAEQ